MIKLILKKITIHSELYIIIIIKRIIYKILKILILVIKILKLLKLLKLKYGNIIIIYLKCIKKYVLINLMKYILSIFILK